MTGKIIHKIELGKGSYTVCGLAFTINEKGENIIYNSNERIGIESPAVDATCPNCIRIWDNKFKNK